MTQMRFTNRYIAAATLMAAAISTSSCGDMARTGQSPVYLVLNSLTASQGSRTSGTGAGHLLSDVITNVTSPAPCTPASPCPTIFNDTGAATFSLALKDVTNPTGPTSNNTVTINRFRVVYRRADGRNTPGVDVPYPFDGAGTVTIPENASATLGFELVRHAAKQESPLVQLQTNNQIITTIAEVTFYGQDRVGNDVTVTGNIQIDFGNFGDQ